MSAPKLTEKPAETLPVQRILKEVSRRIVGQDAMVERLLVGLLTGGHILLEGVPGLAKTLAVRTLSEVIHASFSRIQFTPDLLPADLIGTMIFDQKSQDFFVKKGPVFAQIILADEINRAPAKVQSALLEVMAERQVSIGGQRHRVPEPFLVLATQNPIESEGVYQLPEAQRDRFLMKIEMGHPSGSEELAILYRMSVDPPTARQVLDPQRLAALQRTADQVFVHHAIAEYAVRLVLATRDPAAFGLADLADLVAFGASPRATLGLVAAGRALALLRGREYVVPQDVHDVAREVIAHRLVLSLDALADAVPARGIVDRVLHAVPEPQVAPRQFVDGPDGPHGLRASA